MSIGLKSERISCSWPFRALTFCALMQHSSGEYLENILEQPQVLSALLATYETAAHWEKIASVWQPLQNRPILLTGMGASDSALWPLWFHLNRHGVLAQKVETSQLIHYLPNVLQQPGLLITISQSGESIEIRRLIEQIQAYKSDGKVVPTVLSVTTQPDNFLANHSEIALHTNAGSEVGVATKTFTSTLAVLHLLGRALTQTLSNQDFQALRVIAQHQTKLLNHWSDWLAPAVTQLDTAQTYALVGRGATQAVVEDGALVLKESLRRLASGFTGGTFRHGPMEMLSSTLGVLAFTTCGSTLALHHRLAKDVEVRGGCLVTIGQPSPSLSSVQLVLPPCDEDLTPLLEILPIQLLALEWAKPLGLIPGNFQWSGKVVQQE